MTVAVAEPATVDDAHARAVPEYEIRDAVPDDVEQLGALLGVYSVETNQSAGANHDAVLNTVRGLLKRDHALVLEASGLIVGALCMWQTPDPLTGEVSMAGWFYVAPMAAALSPDILEVAEQRARTAGAGSLFLSAANRRAYEVLQSVGFNLTEATCRKVLDRDAPQNEVAAA